MKKLLLLLLCVPFIGFGQDNIILKSGDEISSKVIEIDKETVKYKKYSNLNGPIYSIDKAEVFMIKYENGEKDIIKSEVDDIYESKVYKYGEKKYGNTGFQFSPYFIRESEGFSSLRFEFDMYAQSNHFRSGFLGLLLGENQWEISFGSKLYGNNETPATFVFTSSINFGEADMLITYSDMYGNSYSEIEKETYTTVNVLMGPFIQFAEKANLTLQIGISFYLPKKDLEWEKPSIFMFKPSIGMRF